MGSWLPWRKLASNPPGLDWPALPWQSRGLYALLLGLANDAGRIPLGRLGLPSLAGGINAPWSEVQPHFDALVSAGWLEVDGSDVALPHFADSQRAATTAERVAEFRKRVRNEPVTTEKRPSNESLPDCNESVTKRELDQKEIRIDQNRSESLVDSDPSQPELALVPQQAADASPKPTKPTEAQVRDRVARALYAEIVAARRSVIASARLSPDSAPKPAGLAGLRASLGQGYTPDQIRHAIKLKVAEVRADPEQARWFVAKWFHPANIDRYSELTEADVTRKPRGQAPQAMRPPEPPKSPRAGESDFQRQIRESRERGEIQ